MAFQDIPFPLDCGPIGLAFTLSAGTVTELDDEDFLPSVKIIAEADNNLQAVTDFANNLVFIAQTVTDVSKITIDGEDYRVIGHAGNGTYGATCIVARDNLDGTESRFVLKEQASSSTAPDEDLAIIKEAIINFALNKATVGYPFFPTIHKVFYSTRNGTKCLYCLIDLLAVDGQKLINTAPDRISKGHVIIWLFQQLIGRLQELFVRFSYNHGDLKPANIMVDHNNQLRLIDFGMSRMELKDSGSPVIITHSVFNTKSSDTKDLTLMAISINYSFNSFLVDPCKTFIDTIDNGFKCTTNVWVSPALVPLSTAFNTAIKCRGQVLRNLGDAYMFNDTNNNPAGSFDVVGASLSSIQVPPVNLAAMGFRPIMLAAPQGPRPSQPGGAKLRRKTKSKRLYRKHGTIYSKS